VAASPEERGELAGLDADAHVAHLELDASARPSGPSPSKRCRLELSVHGRPLAGARPGVLRLKALQIGYFVTVSKAVGGRKVARGFESLPLRLSQESLVQAVSGCLGDLAASLRAVKLDNSVGSWRLLSRQRVRRFL
jgi:hypothetical protein